jgi:hypothetical protein
MSFGSLHDHISGFLMQKFMSELAGLQLAQGRNPALQARPGGSGAAGLPGGGVGRAAQQRPGSIAEYLVKEVPEQYRSSCCVWYWRDGRCSRPSCTYPGGHKCMRCGASDHGGASCPQR